MYSHYSNKHWRSIIVILCILGFTPMMVDARQDDDRFRNNKSQKRVLSGENQNKKWQRNQSEYYKQERNNSSRQNNKSHKQYDKKNTKSTYKQHGENTLNNTIKRQEKKYSQQHNKTNTKSTQKEYNRNKLNNTFERRDNSKKNITRKENGNKTINKRPKSVKQHSRTSHDRHYSRYRSELNRNSSRVPRHHHETYRYHTHYLAPIRRHYHPIGFHLTVLPHSYIRLNVHGLPFFYWSGIYYRHYSRGYVVVSAPIGAIVRTLPVGFIAFSIGVATYYYVNDTYYLWDEEIESYRVVKKPNGADEAIVKTTANRLYVYPKQGQSEELQAKDRYACHRWAVKESNVDPTLDEEEDISQNDRRNYRRAITACLEGRDYTVK